MHVEREVGDSISEEIVRTARSQETDSFRITRMGALADHVRKK